MVERLGAPDTKCSTIPLEVADEFLLLGVDTQDGDAEFHTLLAHIGDMQELRVTFLCVTHREALEELSAAKTEGLKYLTYIVFGNLAARVAHTRSNLRDGQRHPKYVLVLWKSGKMRFYSQTKGINPFWMKGKLGFPSSTATSDAPLTWRVSRAKFSCRFN